MAQRAARGLIVCAMRHLPSKETARATRLAVRYRDRGVIGFDLAGAEQGHPPMQHAAALAVARAPLPITVHAGEADVAERVLEAGRRRTPHRARRPARARAV